MRIGIDPGHGGKDPGAIGPTGVKESDINLAVGLYLAEMLKYNGFEVVLTRKYDVFLELKERSDLLNAAGCSIAVSIHVNSTTNPEPSYICTFIQLRGGKAEIMAQGVQSYLVSATGWQDGGVRVANLHMTRETKMPAILVEHGFISNLQQEKWLNDRESQKKLARAIAQGVSKYFGKAYQEVQQVMSVISWAGKKIEIDAVVEFDGKWVSGGILDGTTVVGVREIAELLGLKVGFDNTTKKVTLSR